MGGQILFPMDPEELLKKMRQMFEEILREKNGANGSPNSDNFLQRKDLLKARQVCDLFQVSKPTLYQWMREGKLKSVKIQSRRFFLWKDIDELIQNNKSNGH